jgi:DNA-binding transcriptional LysR family regulator
MNIRHLRFFVALSREGHYGRAAASCNVTQPTLSEAIRQLERELAVPLIDRNGRRFGGLTPEGGRILGWAQEILANEDALRSLERSTAIWRASCGWASFPLRCR